jgi:large subunit ribosomal protein L25
MKLTVTKREGKSKSAVKQTRRDGNIPAILYSAGKPCETIVVNGTEFKTILREMKSGHLPTTIFSLMDGKHARRAIVKDIQYKLTTYEVSHLDFEELFDDVAVNVKVPISCVGVAECAGVKLGGFLRQVIRFVKVQCVPKLIPTEFTVDVKDLGMRQTKRLKDLDLPKGVKALAPLEEVVVVVSKR